MRLPFIKAKPKTEMYRLGGSGLYEMAIPPGMTYQGYLNAYGQVGWLFGAVSIIANSVAEVGWHLYQTRGGEQKELLNHPLLDLMNKVNPFQTRYEFFQMLVTYRKLVGMGYITLNYGRNGLPVEMWLAPPSYMTVIPHPTQYILGYQFEKGSTKVFFEPNEIICVKDPNPINPLIGLGAAESIGVTIDSERNAERYQNKLFYNDARPGMIITIDEDYPGDEKAKELQLYWEKQHRGMGNAYKTAFLWAKATPHTITLSNKDMDFKELRMYSRDVILGAHHIPLSVMGISENVNRANAEAGEYTFSKRVIKPELTQIREALNEQLCPIFGDDLNFDFDDPVPANREQMVTETVSLLSVGAITREMACQNLGYNIPEDGTYLLPFSVMPTPVKEIKPNTNISEGQPVATNSGDTAENIAAGAKLNGIQIQAAVTVIRDYIDGLIPAAVALELLIAVGIDRERAQSMIDACTNFTPTATQEEVPSNPKVKSYSESQKENMWRSYVGQAEKDEAIFKSTMKRLFESQVSEAKENVGKDSLLNLKQANEDFKKALLPAVEQSFKTGWKFADSTTRRPIKGIEPVLNPLALEWIKNHALELAKGLNETTIDELKVILADGYEMGESIPQLVNRIEEYYMNASRARAEMVARTETIAASNEGAVQLYESEGIEKVEFYPALDERTCDECMSLYKQSPTWTVKEAHGMIPVHPNCRCIFLAVVD